MERFKRGADGLSRHSLLPLHVPDPGEASGHKLSPKPRDPKTPPPKTPKLQPRCPKRSTKASETGNPLNVEHLQSPNKAQPESLL